jgi:heme exporter protein B
VSAGFWSQTRAVADRDVLRERRRGEVVWVTVPFGAIALLLIPLAVGTDVPLLERIGPGLYWAIVMLFGVLVAVRKDGADTLPQQDATLLMGLDPAAGFVGSSAASALLLLGFEVIVGAVAVTLYGITVIGWPWLLLVLVIVAVGLALLGTLAGSIVSSLSAGTALVPLLVAPLSVPLLLGATQAYEGLRLGHSILSWLLLMVIVVLLTAITGVLTARPLQETR